MVRLLMECIQSILTTRLHSKSTVTLTTNGGGWTMLQRRFDGSVDFNQNWTICENTFGSLTGEHWLGLINMHKLTASAPQELSNVLACSRRLPKVFSQIVQF